MMCQTVIYILSNIHYGNDVINDHSVESNNSEILNLNELYKNTVSYLYVLIYLHYPHRRDCIKIY